MKKIVNLVRVMQLDMLTEKYIENFIGPDNSAEHIGGIIKSTGTYTHSIS